MPTSLPTLYKKTSTGAIQYWAIHVIESPDHSTGYDIWTRFGQVNGKEQETYDSIYKGKNIGKKNETTVSQQAEAEALAKWHKQKKKGYVESIEAAQADETDALIEGGILPMLAEKYMELIYDARPGHENDPPQMVKSKHAKKIKFPFYAQPKLDGIRCIAIMENGKCKLWSRTRKPIDSAPHIIQELEIIFAGKTITLDGELYNHDMKKNFEELVSLIRQEEPDPNHTKIQYHIYDMISEEIFYERYCYLFEIFMIHEPTYLRLVDTKEIDVEDKVIGHFNMFRHLHGYEGMMLRNKNSKYVNKRSIDLQKMKEFQDAEFEIIGIEEGRGKLQGHVGSFICVDSKEDEFTVKMEGETEKLREYFVDHSLWQGKELTVRYQGLTVANKVPRFPIGIAIRDYE